MKKTLCCLIVLYCGLAMACGSVGKPQAAAPEITNETPGPLPYHYNMNVWVEKPVFAGDVLTRLELRWVENPDVTDRFLTLSGSDLDDVRRYQPICQGDAFEVRHSILQDANGQVVEEVYSVLRRLADSQCQAELNSVVGQ